MDKLTEQITTTLKRLSDKVAALTDEKMDLQQQLKNVKEGFEGCCYACEPVGLLNQKLEAQLKIIEKDGTEEYNTTVELRNKLTETLIENDILKKLARKLYGTVLHVYALAKEDPLVLIGPMLYEEAARGAKEYEEYNGQYKS